jgi:hypothetical protein
VCWPPSNARGATDVGHRGEELIWELCVLASEQCKGSYRRGTQRFLEKSRNKGSSPSN